MHFRTMLCIGALASFVLAGCTSQVESTETASDADVAGLAQALTSSPDTSCASGTYNGHEYWFCSTTRSWSTARSKCQAVSGRDLVKIESSGENQYLLAQMSTAAWIGATDSTTEGNWKWVSTGTQFWQGSALGSAVGGAYTNWQLLQPDNLLDQDCGTFQGGLGLGKWTDETCSGSRKYICEAILDECPSDDAKTSPGQCGCGIADTDTDGDGTANCNDGCPGDATKTSPGQCGCGNADTDGDGDGTANCVDGCASDPSKVSPGQCGCGAPDTDSDGDGTANCHDQCPADSQHVAPPCSPDTNCTYTATAERAYWFCSTARSWATARANCAAQGFDLARIESSAENQFILNHVTDDSWIGASDSANEGDWRWTGDGFAFWQGSILGHAVGGLYNNWQLLQPDNFLDQDCAFLDDGLGGGRWADDSCSSNHRYVCELVLDQCPMDSAKTAPGQCGCGNPETDGDGDGVADCVDGCATDPGKGDAGQCGCGHADLDADGDGVADCVDHCPADGLKHEPGVCGCGSSDNDSDGDGVLNCKDLCPNDVARTVPGDCGCASAPQPAGTACHDGLCSANTVCDGAGSCGSPSQCPVPDAQCTFHQRGDNPYWFCNDDRSFTEARARCQSVGMDLVKIESAGEDAFITANAAENSFLGGSDAAVEGTWSWLDTGSSFWSGDQSGHALLGAYTNWSSNEPNNLLGLEDCLVKNLSSGGKWTDQSCATHEAFVCEAIDECPSDVTKKRPGICGCGVPDTDSDGNGVADCAAPCDTENPQGLASHFRTLQCADPTRPFCLVMTIAKANSDRQAAAMRYMAGLFNPSEHIALVRDRSRKLAKTQFDAARLEALCDGDDDGDMVPNTEDQCPDTRDLRPTDDVGCEDLDLPKAAPRGAIDAFLANMGLLYDPRCSGASTPKTPTIQWVYYVLPRDSSGKYVISTYPITDQPADCEVHTQFEVTMVHADNSKGFTTLDFASQHDSRVTTSAFRTLFNLDAAHNTDEQLWGLDTRSVYIRVRAMNGNGQRSAWSDFKHVTLTEW